jgi:putative aminophosphonate oxidoreductase
MAVLDRHRSLWLQEALGDAPAAPALEGDERADVAIVGGGYVGLWTAIAITEREPACRVAVVERDVCGGGASGRNGGFVLSWWAKLPTLVRLFGVESALSVARASERAVESIGEFCERHGIDAHYRRAGWLWTATTSAQLGAWESAVAACERLGVDAYLRLSPAEVAARAGSPVHLAGVLERCGATVQPARLVRGLRRVALERGVRVFENSHVVTLEHGTPPRIRTARGSLVAERVVIATNAWAVALRALRRALVVVSSDIVATAPMPDRLREIGWTGGEAITDSQMMVDYYRTTRDGRIAFGKGGWGIALGARIGPRFDRDARRARLATADFHRLYPMLADVPIEQDWSGPIDRSADGLPLLGRLGGREEIVYGVGWSGNGVGPSVIGGRVLASLALGAKDEWSTFPLVDRTARVFPPEPIRYIGAHVVRTAVQRKESAEAAGRRPDRLATMLARLAPAGLEDH